MPIVAVIGSVSTGHWCFPPRSTPAGSGNVFAQGIGVHRVGDGWNVHCCTHSDCEHGCHGGNTSSGSSSVFVNKRPCARIGDGISCGDSIASSPAATVIVGG